MKNVSSDIVFISKGLLHVQNYKYFATVALAVGLSAQNVNADAGARFFCTSEDGLRSAGYKGNHYASYDTINGEKKKTVYAGLILDFEKAQSAAQRYCNGGPIAAAQDLAKEDRPLGKYACSDGQERAAAAKFLRSNKTARMSKVFEEGKRKRIYETSAKTDKGAATISDMMFNYCQNGVFPKGQFIDLDNVY